MGRHHRSVRDGHPIGPDLGLSRQGIHCKQELLPWNEVAGVQLNRFEDVVILIQREGQCPSSKVVPRRSINNLMLFQAMVAQILKPSREGK